MEGQKNLQYVPSFCSHNKRQFLSLQPINQFKLYYRLEFQYKHFTHSALTKSTDFNEILINVE
jgi:hypothetical protein